MGWPREVFAAVNLFLVRASDLFYSGRKMATLTYCLVYILSCMTKHWNDYHVLLLGRVLGGIATSLLWSAFESWLVTEHLSVRAPKQPVLPLVHLFPSIERCM